MSEEKIHQIKNRTYVRVWVALVLLTGVTVSMAGKTVGRMSIVAAATIAECNAGRVVKYFTQPEYKKKIKGPTKSRISERRKSHIPIFDPVSSL